jgi:TolA-binding protein
VDGLLVQLGRAYLAAGRTTEAQQTFERIIKEFPLSPFTSEAQRRLDALGPQDKPQA